MITYLIIAGIWIVSLLLTYACAASNGEELGRKMMRHEAIAVGVAKACDLSGGWRWYTREELGKRYLGHRPPPSKDD